MIRIWAKRAFDILLMITRSDSFVREFDDVERRVLIRAREILIQHADKDA